MNYIKELEQKNENMLKEMDKDDMENMQDFEYSIKDKNFAPKTFKNATNSKTKAEVKKPVVT